MIPIFVAIDTPSYYEAEELLYKLGDLVEVKFGLEFFIANGPEACNELRNKGAKRHRQMFLDLKLHDIPNTVAGAVRSALKIEPDFITLHACDGVEPLMEAALARATDMIDGHYTKLLGVTILTSIEANQELFFDRMNYSVQASLDGIVCPASKLQIAKSIYPDLFRMTPGIRMPNSDNHDQKTVATPKEAMDNGADALVIGRDITKAKDPKAAVLAILETMK